MIEKDRFAWTTSPSLRSRDGRATTSLVGSIILFAVTLSIVGAASIQLSPGPTPPPAARLDLSAGTLAGASTLHLVHQTGAALDLGNLTVLVEAEGAVVSSGPAGAPGTLWQPGQSLDLALAKPLSPGSTPEVRLLDAQTHRLLAEASFVVPSAPTPYTPRAMSLNATLGGPTLPLQAGARFWIHATLWHPDGRKHVRYVSADLSAIGGASWVELRDDGTGGDAVAMDGVYGALLRIPSTASPGAAMIGVRAVDLEGDTLAVNLSLTIGLPPILPGAPTASAVGGLGQVLLAWTPPALNGTAPITGYRISAGATSGAESDLATVGTNTSYLDAGLGPSVLRFYTVSAITAVGQGAASNEVSATTLGLPGAPLALAATGGSGTIALAWSAPASNGGSPITGYRIYAGNASGAEALLATIPANTTFVHAGLPDGATRFYKVTALNAVGESPFSNEAFAATTLPPPFSILPTGGILISRNVTATLAVLGSQITYGAGGPAIPVTAAYTLNGGASTIPLFGGAPVGANQSLTLAAPSGSVVGIHGDAKYQNVFQAAHDSWSGDPHVVVLKNGDTPPNTPGFAGQVPLASFIAPYVSQGRMALGPSQAIILFEFNPSLTGAAVDYNDLVVLVNLV